MAGVFGEVKVHERDREEVNCLWLRNGIMAILPQFSRVPSTRLKMPTAARRLPNSHEMFAYICLVFSFVHAQLPMTETRRKGAIVIQRWGQGQH